MKTFSIDNQEPVTLQQIIDANINVDALTNEEIKAIDSLQIGESHFINIDEIKRLS